MIAAKGARQLVHLWAAALTRETSNPYTMQPKQNWRCTCWPDELNTGHIFCLEDDVEKKVDLTRTGVSRICHKCVHMPVASVSRDKVISPESSPPPTGKVFARTDYKHATPPLLSVDGKHWKLYQPFLAFDLGGTVFGPETSSPTSLYYKETRQHNWGDSSPNWNFSRKYCSVLRGIFLAWQPLTNWGMQICLIAGDDFLYYGPRGTHV